MNKIWGLILGFFFLMTLLCSCSKNSSHNSPVPTGEINSYWYAGVGQFNGSLDFGNLTTEQNKILTVTIKNVGDSSLSGPVSISSSDFFVAYQNCATLLPGKTCSVKISFNSRGKTNTTYSADLTLGEQSALVTASVDLPPPVTELKASVGGSPVSSLNFGTIKFNQNVLKTITITNGGKDKGPWVVGQSGNGFVISYDTCSGKEILPTKSCTLKVSLSGSGKSGEITDTLTLGNLELPLSALVRNLETVAQEDSDIKVILENQAVSSGAVDLGTWNLSQTKILNLYLKNEGTDKGIIEEPEIPENLQIAFNNCEPGKVLNAKASCLMKLVTIPQNKGVQNSPLILQGQPYNLQSTVREPGDKIFCPMDNALEAYITWDGSTYSDCVIEECEEEYHIVDNICKTNELIVNINQPPSEQGIISGPSIALYNTDVVLTYSLPPNYNFLNWTGDCSGSSLTCTINSIQDNITVGVNIGCFNGYIMVDNVCLKEINLTLSSNVANYNIFSAAGSPTEVSAVNLTINSGVDVYSTNTAIPALKTGTFPSGSRLTITNNGRILGQGGNGAVGGSSSTFNIWTPGIKGGKGGDSVELNMPVSIINNGQIFGGGGGGSSAPTFHGDGVAACGGGGGGGQGYGTSSGGAIGNCIPGYSTSRTPGGNGNINGPGSGGLSGGNSNGFTSQGGGAGGAWGEIGGTSGIGVPRSGWGAGAAVIGGDPGKSVKKNGFSINWISGNNTTQVKGPQQD